MNSLILSQADVNRIEAFRKLAETIDYERLATALLIIAAVFILVWIAFDIIEKRKRKHEIQRC